MEEIITVKPDEQTQEGLLALSEATGLRPPFLVGAYLKQIASEAIAKQQASETETPVDKPEPSDHIA